MDFLFKRLQGIAFVPSVVNGIEELFASRSGADKENQRCRLCPQPCS